MEWKSSDEFLVWGKVEKHAIVDCIRVQHLRVGTLDVIAPGLRILGPCYIKTRWRLIKKFPDQRPLSNELLSAAVRLAYKFAMVGGEHIAQAFLGSEFCIKWCCGDDHRLEVEYDRQQDGNLLETFKNLIRGAKQSSEVQDEVTAWMEKKLDERKDVFARKFQEYESSDHAVHRSL